MPKTTSAAASLTRCGNEHRDAMSRAESARLSLVAAIRAAVAEGMPEAEVARIAGISRTTVRKALGK